MLAAALIERTMRQAMANAGLNELSLYPEYRGGASPTTARILEIFTGVPHHQLTAGDGIVLRTFQPELTDPQHQVPDLLSTSPPAPTPGLYMPLMVVREV